MGKNVETQDYELNRLEAKDEADVGSIRLPDNAHPKEILAGYGLILQIDAGRWFDMGPKPIFKAGSLQRHRCGWLKAAERQCRCPYVRNGWRR